MTKIEIRPGPLGMEGGEPFPEVREEMERMERGQRIMRPSFMRLIPNRFIVKLTRKMMGFPNNDISKGRVETRHLSIPGPGGDIPVRLYVPTRLRSSRFHRNTVTGTRNAPLSGLSLQLFVVAR